MAAARDAPIDLTLSDTDEEGAESPAAAAAREAAQRQKIMEFARAKQRARAAGGDAAAGSSAAADATSSLLDAAAAGAAAAAGEDERPQAGTASASAADRPAPSSDAAVGNTTNASTAAAAAGGGFGNSELRALHEARMQRQRAQQSAAGGGEKDGDAAAPGVAAAAPGSSSRGAGSTSSGPITLLTYNVWFKEEVALRQRMQGVADIITAAGFPTFICLQEVTPNILRLFESMPWFQRYTCSPAPSDAPYFTLLLVNKAAAPSVSSSSFEEVFFDNSCMGRNLLSATVTVGRSQRKLVVATSHLESPIPPSNWYSKERKQQMAFSLAQLQAAPYANVLFAGDMNWTDSRDGQPPLPPGWADAWQQLQPSDPGYTYHAAKNPMLPYKNTPPLRLDRIFARLSDYRLASISIVGKEQLGSATYTHRFKSGGAKELPVLPSDHFGLLLQLEEV